MPKHPAPAAALLLSLTLLAGAHHATAQNELSPDSKPQPGVPRGEVLKFSFESSNIFPGTYRDYWVYVPTQYSPDRPACLYVNQDGVQWQAPTVFDNLIHKKEIPVTIGVFVSHGRVRAGNGQAALDRFNRSLEYDGLGDIYARFLIEELLPDVESRKATDGRALRLSRKPEDRAIGGSSSGAVCAFTAAWERPDSFSRVFSAIGTYVGLRGADRFPTLLRKYEPKPLRVFLQDGSNDLNIYAGDWWMANQMMERALTFSGYEVEHAWGDGGHNGNHGTAIFPDAMRWLWKGWPQPVGNGPTRNNTLNEILAPGEHWQLVGEGYRFTEGPIAAPNGEVLFNDIPNRKTHRIGADSKVSVYLAESHGANGQAFGPDGRLYAVSAADSRVYAYAPDGKQSVVADGVRGNDIVVSHTGNIYVTEPLGSDPGNVWLIRLDGAKQKLDTGLRFPNGIMLSPDQTLLYVAESRSHWIYSYQVQPDGTLQHKQKYYWLHVSDAQEDSGADGMRVDRDGRLYVASRLGIQVCDQAGRVNCILPTPNGRVANLCFGGPNSDILYATCGDRVYRRKLKVSGVHAWAAPHRPAPPRL